MGLIIYNATKQTNKYLFFSNAMLMQKSKHAKKENDYANAQK
jgi:hypothetical protein